MNQFQPTVYFAMTSHGFGHVVRSCAIASKLKQLEPNVLLILTTTAPRWLMDSYVKGDFIHRPRSFDVGVIQKDSLNMDCPATLEQLQTLYRKRNSLIASEVTYLKTNQVDLIVGDIPFLIAPIARQAQIPCWLVSNFGWDFIYRDWGAEFAEMTNWITDCYAQCDRLFRLPMSEAMAGFSQITDVGLTGGDPDYSVDEMRQKFNLTQPRERTILLTFGGLGLATTPYHNLERFPDWQFITFDAQAPDLPNLVKVTDKNYRPVDFMPLCAKIVTKPGYSTFAEALKLDLPIISLEREGFAEAHLLHQALADYSPHLILSQEQFYEGNWDFLRQPLTPPRLSHSLLKNGNETIAEAILDYLGNSN